MMDVQDVNLEKLTLDMVQLIKFYFLKIDLSNH